MYHHILNIFLRSRVNFVSNFILLILFLWLRGSLSLLMPRRTVCRTVFPSPLLSHMGVSVFIPSLFNWWAKLAPSRFSLLYVFLFWIWNSLATTLDYILNGSTLFTFDRYHLLIANIFSARVSIFFCFLATIGYSGLSLDIWSRLVVLRYKDLVSCYHVYRQALGCYEHFF